MSSDEQSTIEMQTEMQTELQQLLQALLNESRLPEEFLAGLAEGLEGVVEREE